jgi:bile acid-coenzyme A ligase
MPKVKEVSYGQRLTEIAAERESAIAVHEVRVDGSRRSTSWGELEGRANAAAAALRMHGCGPDTFVALAAGNSLAQVVASFAVWKLGGCVVTLNPRLPANERDDLLDLVSPVAVIADWPDVEKFSVIAPRELLALPDAPAFESLVPNPGRAIPSGGATGRPKIIVRPSPWVVVDGDPGRLMNKIGFRPGQVQLVCAAMHHNAGYSNAVRGLGIGQTIVLMERFDAASAVELIEEFQVEWVYMVPTMMRRILSLPDLSSDSFASLEMLYHTAAACPEWLKRAWIELLGPARVVELYGASEANGFFIVDGEEWLAHPGSVGRPFDCDVRILDSDRSPVPVGEVGEIFCRPHATGASFAYLGASPPVPTDDGFVSVGDLGHLDVDGYLYIADRRVDMIVTGGVNVYPAQVEAALTEHPSVADAVVIGLPDAEWGRRVHAVIETLNSGTAVDEAELSTFLGTRLSREKQPKSYEFISAIPRDDTGKVRRGQLLAERLPKGSTPGVDD